MRALGAIRLYPNFRLVEEGEDGFAATLDVGSKRLRIIASYGGGWDHVSVSLPMRCPTWEEMCTVKDVYFIAEERVVQFHPPQSEYVTYHPYCLHLWRWQEGDFPHPPYIFVGGLTDEETEQAVAALRADGIRIRPHWDAVGI